MKIVIEMEDQKQAGQQLIDKIESDIIIEGALFTHQDNASQVVADLHELYEFWASNDSDSSDADKVQTSLRMMNLINFITKLEKLNVALEKACESHPRAQQNIQVCTSESVRA